MPTYLRSSTPARPAVVSLAVLILAAALAALVAASPFTSPARSEGRPAPLVGAQTHPMWGTVEEFDRELDALKQSGATTVRVDLAWMTLEEGGKGRYSDWYVQKADTFFDHARARNLKVIVDFWGSPCWASSAPSSLQQNCSDGWWGRGVGGYAPRNPSDYADAAAWVARRWGSKITALEVWNEPNIDFFMGNDDAAAAYAGVLKAAYPKIKAAAPELPVLGGVLSGGDTDFLQRLYSHGIKGHHDGISIHPYDAADPRLRPNGEFLTSVPRVREMMVDRGEGSEGLWLTELGFSTCNADSRCVSSEGRQSDYSNGLIRKAAAMPYVRAVVLYNLRDKGTDRGDFESNYGLLYRDFRPKPGFTGFRQGVAAVAGTDSNPGGATPPPSTTPPPSAKSSVANLRVKAKASRIRLRRRQVPLWLVCPSTAGARGCQGRVHVEALTPRVASATGGTARRFTVRRGRARVVGVTVNRKMLARRGRLRVRAVAKRGANRRTSAAFTLIRR